jgi:hypothetical protein
VRFVYTTTYANIARYRYSSRYITGADTVSDQLLLEYPMERLMAATSVLRIIRSL